MKQDTSAEELNRRVEQLLAGVQVEHEPEWESLLSIGAEVSTLPNPEVPERVTRRVYSARYKARIVAELRESVRRVAAEVSGAWVIRLQKRHSDDDVAAFAHDARELANAAFRIFDVLEDRVTERRVEAVVIEGH